MERGGGDEQAGATGNACLKSEDLPMDPLSLAAREREEKRETHGAVARSEVWAVQSATEYSSQGMSNCREDEWVAGSGGRKVIARTWPLLSGEDGGPTAAVPTRGSTGSATAQALATTSAAATQPPREGLQESHATQALQDAGRMAARMETMGWYGRISNVPGTQPDRGTDALHHQLLSAASAKVSERV